MIYNPAGQRQRRARNILMSYAARQMGSGGAQRAYSYAKKYYEGKYKKGRRASAPSGFPSNPKSFSGRTKRRKQPVICSAKDLGKKVCSLEKQVRDLRFTDDASVATLVHRDIGYYAAKPVANTLSIGSYMGAKKEQFETVLANLKFFNPAVPGTLTTADGASGTYQRNYYFKSFTSKLEIRNNYQIPAEVTIYLCRVKDDTSISPGTAWSNGASKQSNVGYTTPFQYPTDYEFFTDLYTSKRVLKKVLSPGQSISCSHTENDIEYDPSLYDSHAFDYQKEYKTFSMLVVVNGILAHDSAVAAEQGMAGCGVDIRQVLTAKVKYEAGINLTYNIISHNPDTFTNGAVVSNQPVSDNQGYSIA